MHKLLVAIPTYNRSYLLEHTLRSISAANSLDRVSVQVFDDDSTAIDWKALQSQFPFLLKIHDAEKNGGPDANIIRILKYFAASDFTHLIFLDADCLVSNDIFDFIFSLKEEPNTVWSAYRSKFHSEKDRVGNFVEKHSLGALGMILTRSQTERFALAQLPARATDWEIVLRLRSMKGRFFTPVKSRIEHIGCEGSHNSLVSLDMAIDFKPTNEVDAKVLDDIHVSLLRARGFPGNLLRLYRENFNSIWRFRLGQILKRLLGKI